MKRHSPLWTSIIVMFKKAKTANFPISVVACIKEKQVPRKQVIRSQSRLVKTRVIAVITQTSFRKTHFPFSPYSQHPLLPESNQKTTATAMYFICVKCIIPPKH